jgi:hypothetical protein
MVRKMSKEEISELEGKISELQRELELWKKYRELADKINEFKKEPKIIYVPREPYHPYYPSYPYATWSLINGTVPCVYDGRSTSGG